MGLKLQPYRYFKKRPDLAVISYLENSLATLALTIFHTSDQRSLIMALIFSDCLREIPFW